MRRRTSGLRARLRRRPAATITVCAVLLGVAGTGAGELTARGIIRDRLSAAAPSLGSGVTVGEGGGWALWDLLDRRIPRLEISSDDAHLGALSPLSVRARLDDVRLGGRPTIGGARVQVTAPPQSIVAAIRTAAPSVQVASVTTDPASGTILAAVGPGGVGQLTLRPVLRDGRVSVTVGALAVFGRTIPADRLGLTDGALGTASGKAYPLGLRATDLYVRPDGLEVTLTAGSTTLAAPR